MKSLIFKLVPRSVKELIKTVINGLSAYFISIFSLNGFTASIYYLLFNRSFYREHRASLKGRIAFNNKLIQIQQSSALLRRNTHRLEKGLIMRPRRESFAEAYVLETVSAFKQAVSKGNFCKDEIKWAADVLAQYFSVVVDKGRIATARSMFVNMQLPEFLLMQEDKSVPYSHAALPSLTINFKQIEQLYKKRRSVRWYQDRKVDKVDLEKSVNVASLAPSACNRQPFFFNFTIDPNVATDIANCAMGTVGFSENIPALIVVVGDLSNYPSERDRHVIYIDASLAAMQLMLALETLGLSSCPINWPDVEDRERLLQDKLGLEYFERPVMLIATGYALPEGEIPFSQKKSASTLLKEIK
ncbi:MAG: nitroreductase [Psychroserpens sp.]|jgi:nitroreductase